METENGANNSNKCNAEALRNSVMNVYFSSLKNGIIPTAAVSQTVTETLQEAEFAFSEKIESGSQILFMCSNHSDISRELCCENKNLAKHTVEDKITSARLESTKKAKKETEEKLKLLDERLKLLSSLQCSSAIELSQRYKASSKKTDRQKWKEQWEQKRREAEEFANRMTNAQKEIQRKNQENMRIMKEKIIKERELELQVQREKEEEEKRKHQEEIKRKIEESEKKRMETKLKIDPLIHKQPYLYEIIQKCEEKEVESELERRKRAIAERRNIYQPIRKSELEEFAQKYQSVLHKHAEDRKQHGVGSSSQESARHHKTKFSEIALHSLVETKQKQENADKERRERIQKMLAYAKKAQEVHAPTPSRNQTTDLLHKDKKRSFSSKKYTATPRTFTHRKKNSVDYKIEKKAEQLPQQRQFKESLQHKTIDYLDELRRNGVLQKPGLCREATYCQTIITNEEMSTEEKFFKVQQQLKIMEREARKKELRQNVKANPKEFLCVEQEVSDMYINAIKAKLSLLKLIPPKSDY